MNAGTCWGKNTIDPRGRGVEKPHEATLTFNLFKYVREKQPCVRARTGSHGMVVI
jgi:hypothetical protein